jgi:hypothetical protein
LKLEDNRTTEKNEQAEKTHQVLQRHFFYHPNKSNNVLRDEELPDPDRVHNIRIMFQQHLNLKSKRPKDCGNENCKSCSNNCLATSCLNIDELDSGDDGQWRGSLQDLNNKKYEHNYERSQSALSNRDDENIKSIFIEELQLNKPIQQIKADVVKSEKFSAGIVNRGRITNKTVEDEVLVENYSTAQKQGNL